MIKLLFCSILSICLCCRACAQRLYKGQKSFQFTAGFVDQISFDKADNSGWFLSAGYARVNRNRTRWVLDGQAGSKYYGYNSQFSKVAHYLGDVSLYIPFIVNYRRNLILSVGVGGTIGHEDVEDGYIFKDGAVLAAKSRFLYGGFAGAESEIYLSNKVVWIVNYKARYLSGSDIGKLHSNLGTGFKFIIN